MFHTLINSGFIYCFIDTVFALKYNILTNPTLPMKLKLFNGSLNNINFKTTFLPVTFLSCDWMILNVYITLLDSSCLLIPRYN